MCENDLEYYSSYMEIDLTQIKKNIELVKKRIGEGHKIMPVLKGNCYGSGTVEVATAIEKPCDIDIFGCAHVFEGIEMRNAGVECAILLLSPPAQHAIKYAIEYNLQMPAFEELSVRRMAEEAKKQGKRAQVHIKIETGMNRIGVKPGEDLEKLVNLIREVGYIDIVGAFTHFATSNELYNDFTKLQLARFKEGVAQIEGMGVELKYVHCCNSNAIVWLDEGYFTHVRTGSLYLGYSLIDEGDLHIGVKETATWRAFIVNIKEVQPGEQVGYNAAFVPEKPTKVATISVGYADGLYRPLAQTGGPVFVNGVKTKYLALCMDQTFVDVTGIDCKIGDEVTLFGYDKVTGELLSAYELQKHTDQTYVYQFCSIGPRVKRIYK